MRHFLIPIGLLAVSSLLLGGCEMFESEQVTAADLPPARRIDPLMADDSLSANDPLTVGTESGRPVVAAEPAPTMAATPQAERYHTVKRGDTLWAIAKQTYGSGQRWQDIVAANPGVRPERLRVGQRIRLP